MPQEKVLLFMSCVLDSMPSCITASIHLDGFCTACLRSKVLTPALNTPHQCVEGSAVLIVRTSNLPFVPLHIQTAFQKVTQYCMTNLARKVVNQM